MSDSRIVSNFEEYGFHSADNAKGNIESFRVHLDNIYSGYIHDPKSVFTLSESERDGIQRKIDAISAKVAKNVENIKKYQNLQEDQRNKKESLRTEIQNLQTNLPDYSPVKYSLALIWTIVVSIIIFFVYGLMMVHVNSGVVSTSVIPEVSKLFAEIESNWISLFYGLVPLTLCFVLEWTFDKGVSKSRKRWIPVMILLVISLDFLFAFAMNSKHNEANQILGLPVINWWADFNFWLVIALGPVPALLLTLLLSFLKHSSNKDINRHKSLIDLKVADELKSRQMEMSFKNDWRKLEDENDTLNNDKQDLLARLNSSYIPESVLVERVNNFFIGWVKWKSEKSRGESEDEFNETIKPFKAALDSMIEKIRRSFSNTFIISK